MAETEGVVIGNLKIPAYKGEKGDKGDAGQIKSITANTLSPTLNATAENIGTEEEAIIVLGIPRGVSISNVAISNGELIITLEDSTVYNLGNVIGRGISEAYLSEGQIYITYTDGTTETAGYIYDDALIQSQLAEIDSAKDDAIEEINQIKGEIDDEKEYIDGVVEDFEESEQELQYILNVLGDIETIIDDINGSYNDE